MSIRLTVVLGAALLLVIAAAQAAPQVGAATSLKQLLGEVQEGHAREARANAAREQRFAAARDQQQGLVAAARAQMAAEQARGDQLRESFASQREALAKARLALEESAGDIDQLRGVVRQLAGDVEAGLGASLSAAAEPARAAPLARIATQPGLPTAEDLETLWRAVLGEAVASGAIARFKAPVIDDQGQARSQTVTRIGAFSLLSEGKFLRHLPETGRLLAIARQPDGGWRRLATNIEDSHGQVMAAPIDPTRGALLGMLAERANLFERIAQAGVVGYLIVAMGLAALAIAAERFVRLRALRRAVDTWLRFGAGSADNPLARLRAVAVATPDADAEALGLKLDETILAELPALRRHLPLLAVLATAAPLMGLLGTVAGMIETFQALSAYGAGDPKVVSGGISLALVATELGLVVAIPLLLAHAGLNGMSRQLIHVLEHHAATLIAEREITMARAGHD